jgi:hypothetical protein
MANTAQVRKPIVSIEGAKADSLAVSWTVPISSFLNGSPTAKLSTHPEGSDKIVSPNAKELIDKIAAAQQAMFDPPEAKNVILNDGNNGVLNFSGFDTGPHHEVMFGGVTNGKTLIHKCARLLFINTSIYEGADARTAVRNKSLLSGIKSPAEAIKKVLQELIKVFPQKLSNDTSTTESTKNVKRKIHEANLTIINDIWFPILDASTDAVLDGFAAAVENCYSLRDKLASTILNTYTNSNTDFSVVISQFESMFQMVFIPSNDGIEAGKFIPNKDIVNGGTEKEVIISSLTMYPGSRKFLTTTAVAIQGAPAETRTAERKPLGPELVSWPATLPANGQTLVLQAPSWIPTDIKIPKTDTSEKKRVYLDVNIQKALDKAEQNQRGKSGKLIKDLLTEFAKQYYCNVTLVEASATVVTALDVTWEIGKRYIVKQSGGDALFSGFLHMMKHTVSSNTTSPQANTQLTFTHVEATGFTLPNKN